MKASSRVRAQRLNYKAGATINRAQTRATHAGFSNWSRHGVNYKGIRFTPKARQPRGKINPVSLGAHPANKLKATSVKYKTAKIRGARTLGPIPIVPRIPQTNYPLLGYKKHGSFVHTLKRSGIKKYHRPLTRGEYTAIRSGLTKQSNAAYLHRRGSLKQFKTGTSQLHSVGFRRSYISPHNKVVYSKRVAGGHKRRTYYSRGFHGHFN
jgi:hypothetical protein